MVVLNIAVIASDELAKSIAKAADQRDVHTYVHKESGPEGARILSLIIHYNYYIRHWKLMFSIVAINISNSLFSHQSIPTFHFFYHPTQN